MAQDLGLGYVLLDIGPCLLGVEGERWGYHHGDV
jgi:hypothetical protein